MPLLVPPTTQPSIFDSHMISVWKQYCWRELRRHVCVYVVCVCGAPEGYATMGKSGYSFRIYRNALVY